MKSMIGPRHVEYPLVYKDLREMLDKVIAHWPTLDAYIFRTESGQTIHKKYADLRQDIQYVGAGLISMKLMNVGEHMSVIGPNSYSWVLAHNACLFGLGISVPLDKQLSDREILSLLERGRVSTFCFDSKYTEVALTAKATLPGLKHLILFDDTKKAHELLSEHPELIAFSKIKEAGKMALAAGDRRFLDLPIDPEAMSIINFTSGTTAMSKGVMLSQRNLTSDVLAGLGTIRIPAGGRSLSVLPLHHTFEGTIGMYCLWATGTCICINENLRTFANNLKEWEITMIIGVPLLIQGLYQKIQQAIDKSGKRKLLEKLMKVSDFLRHYLKIDLRRKLFKSILEGLGGKLEMVVSGAASLAPEISIFFDQIGVTNLCGYGLTESSPVIAATNHVWNKPGSVGHPCWGLEVMIQNEFDYSDAEHPGEIYARGPNIMIGYYENPEATREAIDAEGWLHTGDIGYIDQDGCLYITGRAKSMIVLTNGKKAFPEEFEYLFEQIPGVAQSMAWGEENARGAVDICARFKIDRQRLPEAMAKASDAEISSYLAETLKRLNEGVTEFKIIKHFIWNEEDLIMTTTMKVKRKDETERIHKYLEREGKTMRDLSGEKVNLD